MSWIAGASTVKEGEGGLRDETEDTDADDGDGVRVRDGPARAGAVGDTGGWRNAV